MRKNRPFILKDWYLVKAADANNVQDAKAALKDGAHIDGTDIEGRSALHWAARNGDIGMMDFLIAEGADINLQNDRDRTPLHLAAEFGRAEAVRTLLSAGARVQIRDEMNDTALHMALANGHADAAIALLVHAPHLADMRGQSGLTALHLAAQNAALSFLMTDIAIAANSTLEEKDIFGLTPLHRAAFCDNLAAVKRLVEDGANANSTDIHGMTPFRLAEDRGFSRITNYLKDAPLHRARALQNRHAQKQQNILQAKKEMLRLAGKDDAQSIAVRKPLKPLIRKK